MTNKKQRFGISVFFTVIIFVILSLFFFGIGFLFYELFKNDVITFLKFENFVVILAVISIVIGAVLGVFINYIPLKPLYSLIKELNKLSKGDYSARIKMPKIMAKYPVFKNLEESFNKLASELENTELLRSDFTNNFSHEFKTPIVSIAGFAKLIRKGNIPLEQKEEYLEIIEKESLRLSSLATNMLNLTKVENTEILSDTKEYNLSEQLRYAVLMLEDKWSAKNIEMNIDFDEYTILANYELLMQVWINLVDNAIKYSENNSIVTVEIKEKDGIISVYVVNNSETIPEEERERIFNKFYQRDRSHFSEGSGIGLAIVKKIVTLHKGEVFVKSEDGINCFTVRLPKNI